MLQDRPHRLAVAVQAEGELAVAGGRQAALEGLGQGRWRPVQGQAEEAIGMTGEERVLVVQGHQAAVVDDGDALAEGL